MHQVRILSLLRFLLGQLITILFEIRGYYHCVNLRVTKLAFFVLQELFKYIFCFIKHQDGTGLSFGNFVLCLSKALAQSRIVGNKEAILSETGLCIFLITSEANKICFYWAKYHELLSQVLPFLIAWLHF